jgi:predicted TIM-barrel fold metal-dependent hydrolase
MKNQLFRFLVILALVYGCSETAKQDKRETQATEKYSGPIIDMHIHAFTDSNRLMGMTHPPTLRGKTYEGVTSGDEQKEKTLEKFREHNIVKAIVTNGQLWFDDASETILIGEANKELDALRKQHQEGGLHAIAEMSPFYAGILADDPSQIPYFELAQELDIPVGFHILPGGPNYGFHLMPEMLGGMRTYNASPLQLEDVLVKYPNLRLYIMHGGWPYVDDVKALMYAHPNLYVDVAVVNWILPQEEFNAYLKALINAGFGDRIMFGSDQMVWPQVISVGIESVNNADFLTLVQKEDIFYDNAAKFLGLTEEEIEKHKSP